VSAALLSPKTDVTVSLKACEQLLRLRRDVNGCNGLATPFHPLGTCRDRVGGSTFTTVFSTRGHVRVRRTRPGKVCMKPLRRGFAVAILSFHATACGSSVPTVPGRVPSSTSSPAASSPTVPTTTANPSAPVQQTTYEMTGVVTDDQGSPIPSAVVTAFLDDFVLWQVNADGTGHYNVRFSSSPGFAYYPSLDPSGAAGAVVIADISAPGYDPYAQFISAPAEQFARNFRLHRQRQIAAGEAATVNVSPDDGLCVTDVWPGRGMICHRIHIIPSANGLLTVEAVASDGGPAPAFFEVWRLDGRGGLPPSPGAIRVAPGSEVDVAIGVPWGLTAQRSFLVKSDITP
jgi:hypothetical protein